jgi:hypothetical protein
LTLQSDANASQFSYPDYEAYRDQLHCFSGLIASSHDLLKLTEAGGVLRDALALRALFSGVWGCYH